MARPKKDETTTSATTRMENAFWELLETTPYRKITVNLLCKYAGVNHNLLYYYYENIDDLAKRAFDKNVESEVAQMLLAAILDGTFCYEAVASDAAMLTKFQRMQLFMRDGSAYLSGLARDAIFEEWLKAVGVCEDDLTDAARLDLTFIISGLMAVLGSDRCRDNPLVLSDIVNRPLGRGIAATLKHIRQARYPKCSEKCEDLSNS